MQMTTPRTSGRKVEHVRIVLEEDVDFKGRTTGFERYRFVHCALPEIDLARIDLSTEFLGKRLKAPLLVSSMTGGATEVGCISTEKLNKNLAQAAQEIGVAMGLGSQRAALEDRSLTRTFAVRDVAPDILLMANLGAVQLNYGYGVDECQRAVDMIEADGLILHLNPLHECLQPRGDTNFAGLLRKIEKVCQSLTVPVVVKEVGWGISAQVARQLVNAGIAAIDVAGSGGTSWGEVEKYRATECKARLVETFRDWGIPTARSIEMVREALPDVPVIASGGIRTGLDVAKATALGADLAGIATPLLRAAQVSSEAVRELLEQVTEELRLAMFCVGTEKLGILKGTSSLRRI